MSHFITVMTIFLLAVVGGITVAKPEQGMILSFEDCTPTIQNAPPGLVTTNIPWTDGFQRVKGDSFACDPEMHCWSRWHPWAKLEFPKRMEVTGANSEDIRLNLPEQLLMVRKLEQGKIILRTVKEISLGVMHTGYDECVYSFKFGNIRPYRVWDWLMGLFAKRKPSTLPK